MNDRFPLPQVSEATPKQVPIPDEVPTSGRLIDTFGRVHNNLRISVTDRCNLRCTYCMPEDVTFQDKHELLTFEEITHFVRIAASLGVDKVRLTGGEPLMRRDLPKLVLMIAAIPGIVDIGLTTNGLLLARHAAELYAAGLRRLNVSLDTLDPGRFHELTRRDGVEEVVNGLSTARAVGFAPIKVNAVAIRGFVEHDAVPLARFCRDNGYELRFIEYMPIGAEAWEREKVVSAEELLTLIAKEVAPLQLAKGHDSKAPSLDYEYTDGRGCVGVIASVSRPFCSSCNRVRLTADGKLRNCLFARLEVDVRAFLRSATPDETALAQIIRTNVMQKWAGHDFNTDHYVKPDRTMHNIGG